MLAPASLTQLIAVPTQIRTIGVRGKQNSGEGGVDPDDDGLFEINITNAAVTQFIKLPFVPEGLDRLKSLTLIRGSVISHTFTDAVESH